MHVWRIGRNCEATTAAGVDKHRGKHSHTNSTNTESAPFLSFGNKTRALLANYQDQRSTMADTVGLDTTPEVSADREALN